jgi:hypothetical protein
MPPTFIGVVWGNNIPLCFAGLAGGLLCLRRRPFLAGLLFSIGWLKPTVVFPFVALLLLFCAPRWARVIAGIVAGTLVLLTGTLVTTGPSSLLAWSHALGGYSQSLGIQPQIVTLSAVVQDAPVAERLALQVGLVAVLSAVTLLVWFAWRNSRPVPLVSIAPLWCAWFLALPYAHRDDEIMLTIPVLVMLLIPGVPRRFGIVSAYLVFSCVILLGTPVVGWEPLKLAGVGVCSLLAARAAGWPARERQERTPEGVQFALDSQ